MKKTKTKASTTSKTKYVGFRCPIHIHEKLEKKDSKTNWILEAINEKLEREKSLAKTR